MNFLFSDISLTSFLIGILPLSSDELERHEDYFLKLAIQLLSDYKVLIIFLEECSSSNGVLGYHHHHSLTHMYICTCSYARILLYYDTTCLSDAERVGAFYHPCREICGEPKEFK